MVDRRLRRFLPEAIEALTVRECGWGPLKNGGLLKIAQHEFDVLLTADQGIPYQQNLPRFNLAVVVLKAETNSLEDLIPLMARVSNVLTTAQPGETIHVEA